MANAADMINACYRHQHLEVFGRAEIFASAQAPGSRADELPTQGAWVAPSDPGLEGARPIDVPTGEMLDG